MLRLVFRAMRRHGEVDVDGRAVGEALKVPVFVSAVCYFVSADERLFLRYVLLFRLKMYEKRREKRRTLSIVRLTSACAEDLRSKTISSAEVNVDVDGGYRKREGGQSPC
jgi:hypothetical protein